MTQQTFPRRSLCTAAVLSFLGFLTISSCILVRGRSGDSIRFPIEPHLDVIDDCAMCHDGVVGHDVTSETRRALEAACFQCHEEQKEDCSFCHSDVASAGVFPDKDRHLAFSHEAHLVRTFGDCYACHEPLEGGAAADAAHPTYIPQHVECFDCHEMQEFYDELECTECHEALFEYGLKPYQEFSHDLGWLETHGEFMRGSVENEQSCAQCHARNFCSDCHGDAGEQVMRLWERWPDRPQRSFIHAGDYLFRHQWDARADAASCASCHSTRECNDCHDSRGITERTSSLRADEYTFHGPGVLTRGSLDFHGTAARRDILSCAACHSDGARGNCIDCHTVGAIGGNPHPPGFESRLSRTGAPVCRMCHVR